MVNISPVIEECGKSTMTNCQVENLYYDVKTLINLFFKEPHNAKMELKPSVYLEEMSLSFEERIDSLSTIQHRKVNFPGYVPSKYFTINPPFILIQSFTCGKPYTVTLELKCTAKAMKSLTLVSDRDPVLTVECTSKLMTRIAPGMSVKYKVTFLPVKVADYYHQILFETEGESFRIPILALKPRPLLDFPDHIQIPPTPVKITGHKTFVLRNIGSVEAVFTLECSNGLFMVEPDKVKLQPGNLITITLKMFSVIVGVFTSSMKVVLETGEELSISVEASTVNSSVSIDEKRLILPEVFMTLRERRSIQLVNNSDNLVHFSWQKHSSLQEDLQELERLKQQMKGVEELESVRCNVLEYNGIINAELHSSIYKRIYTDEIMLLGSDNLLFQHENFKIIPLSGEVWPGSSIEIMVIFEANTPLTAKCRAYCECTGIEDRLELVVEGRSIGPDLKINLSVLNISKVPLSAEKTFEILAKNCGDIPGNLEYVENEKVSKAKISCKPRKLYLLPGETKAFFINLCSISRGEFMEELKFVILESKEEIDFVVLGEVLRPNIYFDRNEINFGNVPLGFPIVEIVHLKNNSLVAIPFSMSVPQDGFEPALTCESFSQSKRKFYLPQSPQEFTIKPSSGEIGAGETKQIKIIFTPNKYRVLAASLVLELNVNTEAETSSVKLSANAISPMIVVLPEVIKSPFCFINYEYRQTLTLRNISSAPGYFHIMPQVVSASTGLSYHISEEEVMIDGLEVIEIELTWIVTQVGKHVEIVKMLLFGEQNAEVLCELQCSGQGPMVTLIPNELHFGRVQLLTYQALAVELINDSPIDAHFAAVEGEKDQFFVEIDPECGVLEANSRVRLTVGIRLYDSGNVTQNILINIKNGRQLVLCINAKGHGSSIVITPSISPVYNLGKLASNKHYTIPLRTTNHSTKLHTLYWSKDMKCKLMPHYEDSTEWKNFRIDPCKIDIPPHKSSIVNLHVFSESEGEINEQFYVFAAIDNKGARFLLNKVLLKVEFINRGLELSKSSLHFRIDITPDRRTLMNQTQTIIANNNTDLTILCKFQVKRPFLILDNQNFGTEDRIIHFGKNSSQPIDIIFSPSTSLNSISTVFKGTLRVSYRDVEELISLSGEINYPNLELSRRELHFGTVPPFSSRSCEVELINDGVLTAFYLWEVTVKSENIMPCVIDGELIRNSSVMDCKPSFCSFTSEASTSDSQVLNINPSFGQIEGYKNLRITFTFFPCFMKSYIIEASCHVIGGRCQTVTIFGGSAQVQYSLEPRHVDFGFRSFNDMHRQNITITNLCEMELHVTANKNLVEHSEALLNSGLFVVSPTFQKIAGLSSATIQVTYYPRICQQLKDEFIIQVNTANPILVEVKGYGTLPQVIISNPCRTIVDHDIPIATFYPAISWLTSPMFDSLWKKASRLDLESHERSIDNDFSDWVFITNEDEYPTVEDIDLALQRMLTYTHLLENGLLDSKNSVISRTRPYLELPTPSPEYVVDFGKVVVDSVVDQNILIKNANMLEAYPQVSVILPFSARTLKDSYNVVLTFIKNSKSKAGVNILNVKLKPIRMTYSSKVTPLNLNVFVVVKGGLKIPMRISAVITIPFLTAVTKTLNFMEILVGEEKMLSLQIKNEGFVSCEWSASLKFMHRPSAKSNPFSLKSSYSGYLESSEDHIVEVSFRPEFKGKYDYSLIFEVKQNSEPIKINLQGCAIEPNLHITNNNLTFPTVFPNVEDNSKTFTVENRSSFPVEVYFPDYDRFCREEESAIRLLCTIYSTDQLPLLPNQYGTSLNTKLLNRLQNFLEKMRVYLSTLLKERADNHNFPSKYQLYEFIIQLLNRLVFF
ncbi:hydrocephalus-inducing protein-like [Nilaparvata lugens]|uniref:hydrocephalus-inducing protein-like n=1 Tax=Nilaparvata lugens TaxID=108931 RepID=UPI00193D3E90|nr:hydrocephalus-inducing protein-like [Nilaparvata lugens]